MTTSIRCPQCNAGMVLRTASRGSYKGRKFYGCSRYPRCNGIQNIDETTAQAEQANAHSGFEPNSDTPPPPPPKQPKNPLTEAQKRELQRLRDRLLNVSSRNRSIRLSRIDKKSAFDLSCLNELDSDLPTNLIEHCLTKSTDISLLPPKTAETEEQWNKCSDLLNHLHRNITEIQKEKGLHDLYIGYPFLAGKPAGTETIIQAPIFLIPVHLEKIYPKKGAATWVLKPSQDVKAVFNKTLFFALSKLCNLSVNEELFEEEVPNELYGETHFVELTQKLLGEYGIPATVQPDALDRVFDKVREFTVSKIPEEFKTADLQLLQYGVLGHFPQSNSSLQRDYDEFLCMDQDALDGITCFLSEEYLNADQDPDESLIGGAFDFNGVQDQNIDTIEERQEKDNFMLLPSDSSQDKILIELAKKSTDGIVVWGPPGTGKSQTIVNIVADCIAKKKTVLLVSQKRAALDVVYDRLAGRHMESLVALVHDTKDDRKDLYKKIAQACGQGSIQPPSAGDPSSEIDRIVQTLKDVHKAYNDDKYGVKFGNILQFLASYKGPTITGLGAFWKALDAKKLDELCQSVDSFSRLRTPKIEKRFDSKRKDFSGISSEAQRNLAVRIERAFSSQELLDSIFINRLAVGERAEGTPTESGKAFRDDYHSFRSDTSFLRFFRSVYWHKKRKILARIHSAMSMVKDEAHAIFRELETFFDEAFIRENLDFIYLPQQTKVFLSQVQELLDREFDTLKSIDSFRKKMPKEFVAIESQLRELGQNSSLSWGTLLKASVYALWEADLENRHSVISMIRSDQIDQMRERLKLLLDLKMEYCVRHIRSQVSQELRTPAASEFTRTLTHEVEKKRSIPPVRKLNEKFIENPFYRSVLPVWLVSPETVSDVFPLKKGLFDVVIFDEASQCTVESGLPAIFRGKQVVVAGDEKQLPPSRLFETTYEEDEDEDSFASIEPSLLTLAKKTLRYKTAMLEWHYRSKHQELVSYSNEVFYNGRMKISPNVMPFVKGNIPAITWHSVTGFWTNRSNEQEAARVMELIHEKLRLDKPPTIGVITFNINQKNLILDCIDKKIASDPEFAALMEINRRLPVDKQLFVKNIENVQGDEREQIIFSVAYAPIVPGGRVQQTFGLLNQVGGENRLNVAITRAIEAIHIICSINPETDLSTSTLANQGPKIFHKYLCFARAVSEGNFDRITTLLQELNPNLLVRSNGTNHFDSPFEEEVYNELISRGYEVHSQVGQSGFRIDLAVVHPKDKSKYALGIECDGAMFHSAVSVRERDVFRQKFLETRGWKIVRIWSPSWRKHRNREIMKLLAAIDETTRSA